VVLKSCTLKHYSAEVQRWWDCLQFIHCSYSRWDL